MRKREKHPKLSPSNRYLRDSLLLRDPVAKSAGEEFLNKVMLLTSMEVRLPPDRLVSAEHAARIIGVEPEEFERLAFKAKIKPKHVLSSVSYWLVGDVYALVD